MSLHASTALAAPLGVVAGDILATEITAETSWPETFHMPGTAMSYLPDQEIYGEHAEASMFFKVVSGTVRICKFLSNGQRQVEAFYMGGGIFGLDAFDKHRFSAEAVSNCTLVAYRRKALQHVAMENGALAQLLFTHALRDAARAQDHSLLLGRRGAVEKVGAFLLDCARRAGEDRTVILEMPRADIADYLGLTIETVSRTLSKLEREGAIELITARNIRIKKHAALQALSD